MAFRILDAWVSPEIEKMVDTDQQYQMLFDRAQDLVTLFMDMSLEPTFAFDAPYVFLQYFVRRLDIFYKDNALKYFGLEFVDAQPEEKQYAAELLPTEKPKHYGVLVASLFAGVKEGEMLPFIQILCADIEENYPAGYFIIERDF